MISETNQRRCPIFTGIHLTGARCPLVVASPRTEADRLADDNRWRAFLERLKLTPKWT